MILGLILSPAYAGNSARDEIKGCMKEARAARDHQMVAECKRNRGRPSNADNQKDDQEPLTTESSAVMAGDVAGIHDPAMMGGGVMSSGMMSGHKPEYDEPIEESCLDIISEYDWRTEIDEATACCIVEEANNWSCFDKPEGEERDACLNGAASSCGDFEPNDLIEIRH